CGIYGIYVVYQLVRRSRDHNARRLELLDAATALAWQRAEATGISNELQPNFNRISAELDVLRRQCTQFRDPVVWMLLAIVGSGARGLGAAARRGIGTTGPDIVPGRATTRVLVRAGRAARRGVERLLVPRPGPAAAQRRQDAHRDPPSR